MILEYKYTFSEYFEGVRNASWATRMLSWFGPIMLVLAPGLILLNYLLGGSEESRLSVLNYLLLFGITLFWALIPLLQAWLTWRGNPHVKEEILSEVSDDGVRMKTSMTDSLSKWESFIKTRETRNLFLLYLSKHMVYMFPKRAFQDGDQIQEFRNLLQQKIAK